MSSEIAQKPELAIVPVPNNDANNVTPIQPEGGRLASRIVRETTEAYLATLPRTFDPEAAAQALVALTNVELLEEAGAKAAKDALYSAPDPWQIAQLAIHLLGFARVVDPRDVDDETMGQLGMRQPGADVYSVSSVSHRRALRVFAPSMDAKGFKVLEDLLFELAPVRKICRDASLVPVQNGVFDFATKTLRAFTASDVFLTKSPISYFPDAQDHQIEMHDGAFWTVESWMSGLSADPEIVQVLWEMLAAVVRPGLAHKACFMVSPEGNNGKGTLLQVLEDLVGRQSSVELSLDDFANDALVVNIAGKALITGNENKTNVILDDVTQFKRAVTSDPMPVNRKYLTSITIRSFAFIVQSLNNANFRILDTSGAFYRRAIMIPFSGTFTGIERKYIKGDYLRRPEVLQYILRRVLEMEFTEISEPAACLALKEQNQLANNRVLEFWNERGHTFAWDALPLKFLHELFGAWQKRTNPGSPAMGQARFSDEVTRIAVATGEWERPEGRCRPGASLRRPEPMLLEFDLDTSWLKKNQNTQILRRVAGHVAAYAVLSQLEFTTKVAEQTAAQAELDQLTQLINLSGPQLPPVALKALQQQRAQLVNRVVELAGELRAAAATAERESNNV